MIENISRHREEGADGMTAARQGSAEIGFTVISLTASLLAVFIPLLFMSGLVGRMFREFAVTLSIAVVVSAIVSLTLTPMMCARLLKAEPAAAPGGKRGLLGRISDGFGGGLARAYAVSLAVVLRHRGLTLLVTLGTVAATIWLYMAMPKSFLPCRIPALSASPCAARRMYPSRKWRGCRPASETLRQVPMWRMLLPWPAPASPTRRRTLPRFQWC